MQNSCSLEKKRIENDRKSMFDDQTLVNFNKSTCLAMEKVDEERNINYEHGIQKSLNSSKIAREM